MKKFIACFSLAAFAAVSVFAAETVKEKPACNKAKTECKSKSECCKGKTACSKTPSKQSLLSPKASESK